MRSMPQDEDQVVFDQKRNKQRRKRLRRELRFVGYLLGLTADG
jgi:hypothetical protein